MIRLYTLFLTMLLFISCATVEEAADEELHPSEPDPSEEITENGELPDWYGAETEPVIQDGVITAFSRSPGSDVEWARENAVGQAEANLRFLIDRQVEHARSEVAAEYGNASDRSFILQVRRAVNRLELTELTITDDFIEGEDGTLHVFVKAETPASGLLEELANHLSGYSDLWNRMVETEHLRNWQETL